MSGAVLVGAIVGQVSFGAFADKLGRKRGLISTGLILFVFTLLSALAYGPNPSFLLIYLSVVRFFLGVGIGGEYPVAATSAAESSEDGHSGTRGRTVGLVFAMQGVGSCVASAVVLLLLHVFSSVPDGLQFVWRVALGVGCVPVVIVFWLRLRMEETSHYKAAAQDSSGRSASTWRFLRVFVREYGRPLFGTSMSWLLFDIVFYGA